MDVAGLDGYIEHAPNTSSLKKLADDLILKGILFIGKGLVLYIALISKEECPSKDE